MSDFLITRDQLNLGEDPHLLVIAAQFCGLDGIEEQGRLR